MRRVVEPEWLDSLPPSDPHAVRSRADLRRVNRWMRNDAHLLNAIHGLPAAPRTILELGAGDGTLMLRLAERLNWSHRVRLFMLDRAPVVEVKTVEALAKVGWDAEVIRADLHQWIRCPEPNHVDLIVANLFLHHFSESELKLFLQAFSHCCKAFISCEPRRWRPSLAATRLLWLIGCNHVTRHDAYLSVRAGFRSRELSALWPSEGGFVISESSAGHSSHVFVVASKERCDSL